MFGKTPKTVFVHIGHYKTGSSAIQDYLHNNAGALEASGFRYPACCRPKRNHTNHGHLSLSLARDHGFVPPQWYGENIATNDAYAALKSDIRKTPAKKVIVSSEEFTQLALRNSSSEAVGELKRRLSPHRVKIVLYIREPFSLLKSWYNQVNKGPVGTRNFPTFFMNLAPGFLNQYRIWAPYAEAFGAENVIVMTYKHVGADHISEFLQAVGCTTLRPEQIDLTNPAQDTKTLELARLAKDRKHSYDEATVTNIDDIAKFMQRVENINARYEMVAAMSDKTAASRLTPSAIIRHYAELLRPARAVTPLNQAEADKMRDLALQAEKIDLDLASALMEIAQIIRPKGEFIQDKLAAYRSSMA